MNKIVNKIVKILITSDFFLNLGWGLLSPIFAIFVLERITKGDSARAVEIAGFSALVYWLTKSLFEIPIGYVLDKIPGERDDFWFMVLGTLITALIPLGFLVSTNPMQIYIFQALHAFGMAMSLPSWLAIFTRHIDKGKEAFEWSLETTSIGVGAGIAGGVGGIVAAKFGFDALFISVSILTFMASFLLLLVRDNIYPKIRDGASFSSGKPVVEP